MHYIVNMILCHFLFCLVKSKIKMNKIHLLQQDLHIYFTYIIYHIYIANIERLCEIARLMKQAQCCQTHFLFRPD